MNGLVPALRWRESLAARGWTIYRPGQVSFVLPTPAPGPSPASVARAQAQGSHCPGMDWVPAPASPTWTESLLRKPSKGRETMQAKGEGGPGRELREKGGLGGGQAECSGCWWLPLSSWDRDSSRNCADTLSSCPAPPLPAFYAQAWIPPHDSHSQKAS